MTWKLLGSISVSYRYIRAYSKLSCILNSISQDAFDLAFSVGILRARSGLDFSEHIQSEETEATDFVDGK